MVRSKLIYELISCIFAFLAGVLFFYYDTFGIAFAAFSAIFASYSSVRFVKRVIFYDIFLVVAGFLIAFFIF